MTTTKDNLPHILAEHRKWLRGEGGSRADLSGAELSGAYLSGAYLSGANLSHANLSGAYLSGAELSGAELSGAYLSGANLSHANLSGAELSGAYLSGANLSHANLSGAYLSGANLIDGGQRVDGYRIVAWLAADGRIMIRAGCRNFDMADARAHWEKTRGGTPLGAETLAILSHIESVARIRGWAVREGA
jgi:uncharacterized protein YjbI with pentapeptide repeats